MSTLDPLPNWIVKSKSVTVAITDLKGNYAYVNQYFCDRFFWLPKDIVGTPFAKTVHPDDVEKCNEAAAECIANPNIFVCLEVRKPINNTDEYKWTEWEFSLYKNAKGEPIGIICLGYDITNLKKTVRESIKKDFLIYDIGHFQSHNVRGPIATIKGLIELLHLDRKDAKLVNKYLAYLKAEANKLDDVVHKITKMINRKNQK